MSNRLNVKKDGKDIYDIIINASFDQLGEEAARFDIGNRKLCIVSDSNVAPFYLQPVSNQLRPQCRQVDSFIIPSGEEYKNLNTVRDLYEFLILKHYDRGDMLVALGGGVIGDLCGFTAATYLRGIRFIQIPTTLLSQVDSSIGGKTGVDFDAYKNMVGAFHMPVLVYTNTATLRTLSEEQFASGMGEVIKHGLIRNREYYHWIQEHADRIVERDLDLCEAMILESDKIKRAVVEKDPTEQGERAHLNFGHTLGHAIEKLMNFQMPHGHCVALGCMGAAYLSCQRNHLDTADLAGLRRLFLQFGLPVSLRELNLESAQIIAATKNDKKMDSNAIKFILLTEIGQAYIDRTVSDEEMLQAIHWLTGGIHENQNL